MAAEAPAKYDIPGKYKAIVYDKPGTISTKIVELDTPEPGPVSQVLRAKFPISLLLKELWSRYSCYIQML
jgi:hypothetical protein